MAKQKFYVVWAGRKTGIFKSWEECAAQTQGFAGAEYKSFKTLALAEQAFTGNSNDFIGKDIFETELTEEQILLIGPAITNSICVDAAWNTFTGVVEYQGIDNATGEMLFKVGPLEDGTNNIAEFLAIVHALAHCKQHGLTTPIYSDSRNVIGWVRDKAMRTNHTRSSTNEKLFAIADRAVDWLQKNEYANPCAEMGNEGLGRESSGFREEVIAETIVDWKFLY